MKPKHTPGPWEVANIQNDDLWILVRENADEERSVCRISIDGDVREESEANARLIAAAPELLEALELALTGLAKETPNSGRAVIAHQIKETIAKATGGEE